MFFCAGCGREEVDGLHNGEFLASVAREDNFVGLSLADIDLLFGNLGLREEDTRRDGEVVRLIKDSGIVVELYFRETEDGGCRVYHDVQYLMGTLF